VSLGIGIDLIEVARIHATHERFGDRFLKRLLRPDEIAYCLSHRDPAPFIAARFAAKEAIGKAFGTGIGSKVGWQDLEVGRHKSGQPYVILHGHAQRLFEDIGGRIIHLSLTHTENYAAAVALLEGKTA
jgi:holo-[acyl-carrier protein] synthase